MNIAVCLSGQPRTFLVAHTTFDKIKSVHDVDFYLHAWVDKIQTASVVKKDFSFEHIDLRTTLSETYNPVGSCFEKQIVFSKKISKSGYPHQNIYSLIYSRMMSMTHIWSRIAEYDCVILARYDMDIPDIDYTTLDLTKGNVYGLKRYTDPDAQNKIAISDTFFIGHPSTMLGFVNQSYANVQFHLENDMEYHEILMHYNQIGREDKMEYLFRRLIEYIGYDVRFIPNITFSSKMLIR